jgi:hypothetical protein
VGSPLADGKLNSPAEFVDDLLELRRLVTKYGKKGLADVTGLLGG